jgi:hypothetical protein
VAALLLAACSNDSQYQSLLTVQANQAKAITDTFAADPQHYAGGEWDPTLYNTAQPDGFWEKEQWPAVTMAVAALYSRSFGDTAAAAVEARIAIDTVNQAIAQKQHPDGSFGESGVVGGTFWAQAEGLIALVLQKAGAIDTPTLDKWAGSLGSYASWLESSGNATWYVNGNDNLRMTLILLEASQLAQLTGSAYASTLQGWYQASQAFVVNPCAATQCSPQSGAWGWHQVTPTSGYFSETPPGNGFPNNYGCSGPQPCTGFDPYYVTLQLYDALTGYILSGHDSWWQNIIVGEWHMEQPLLIDGGALNASNGSRQNLANPPFDPSVYAVLDAHNLEQHDDLWLQQNADLQQHFQWMEQQPLSALSPNDWGFISSPASGVLDALYGG